MDRQFPRDSGNIAMVSYRYCSHNTSSDIWILGRRTDWRNVQQDRMSGLWQDNIIR